MAERHARGNGQTRAAVQQLGKVLIHRDTARERGGSRVGNAQELEDVLNPAVLAADPMQRDKGGIPSVSRHVLQKRRRRGVDELDRPIARLRKRMHHVFARRERDLALVRGPAREDRNPQILASRPIHNPAFRPRSPSGRILSARRGVHFTQ